MTYGLYFDYSINNGNFKIIFDSDAIITSSKIKNNLTLFYSNESVVKIEIINFKDVMKIKGSGFLPLINSNVLSVINNYLKNNGLDELPLENSSGFVVGKIINVNYHQNSIFKTVLIDLGIDVKQVVCSYENLKKDMLIVYAYPQTFLKNGKQSCIENIDGIESFGHICGSNDFDLDKDLGARNALEVTGEYALNTDFFQIM